MAILAALRARGYDGLGIVATPQAITGPSEPMSRPRFGKEVAR
jgi:hypothetical protein